MVIIVREILVHLVVQMEIIDVVIRVHNKEPYFDDYSSKVKGLFEIIMVHYDQIDIDLQMLQTYVETIAVISILIVDYLDHY